LSFILSIVLALACGGILTGPPEVITFESLERRAPIAALVSCHVPSASAITKIAMCHG
jgi:hypothetical protein